MGVRVRRGGGRGCGRRARASSERTCSGAWSPAAVAFGLAHELEGGGGGGGEGGRRRGGEDEGAGPVLEDGASARACPRRTRRSEPKRLAEGADEGVGRHAGGGAESAAGGTERAERVRLIHHQGGADGAGDVGEVGQGGGVAVHAEEGLGDEDAAPVVRGAVGQGRAGGGDVEVGVDPDGGAGEAAAIDDAGVVGRVGDDEVAAVGQRG